MTKAFNLAQLINSNTGNSQRTITQVQAVDGQQVFTPQGGYMVGYLDVYWNGARLASGLDYTASDGETVTISTRTVSGDVVEMISTGINE